MLYPVGAITQVAAKALAIPAKDLVTVISGLRG